MRAAASRWNGSPEWLAQASASSASGRSRPARTMAEAWIGLLAERAKTAPVGSPTAHSTEPSGAVTTTVPRWTLSTKPPRTTCARIGASVSALETAVERSRGRASGTAVSVPERVCERAGPHGVSRTGPVSRWMRRGSGRAGAHNLGGVSRG